MKGDERRQHNLPHLLKKKELERNASPQQQRRRTMANNINFRDYTHQLLTTSRQKRTPIPEGMSGQTMQKAKENRVPSVHASGSIYLVRYTPKKFIHDVIGLDIDLERRE